MDENKIPCPKCKTIMVADLHKNPNWDNWYCPKCESIYDRDELKNEIPPNIR